MKKTSSLPGQLCFPLPPARIDRATDDPMKAADAARYLTEIQRWREAVRTAILAGDPAIDLIDHFTTRARSRLGLLLEAEWDPRARHWAAVSGHGLSPFPTIHGASDEVDPVREVFDVLRWRAAVVHYLTDAWVSSGMPRLEMGECAAIGAFMRPARLQGRCVYCLTEYPGDRIDPEDHGCVMAGHMYAG